MREFVGCWNVLETSEFPVGLKLKLSFWRLQALDPHGDHEESSQLQSGWRGAQHAKTESVDGLENVLVVRKGCHWYGINVRDFKHNVTMWRCAIWFMILKVASWDRLEIATLPKAGMALKWLISLLTTSIAACCCSMRLWVTTGPNPQDPTVNTPKSPFIDYNRRVAAYIPQKKKCWTSRFWPAATCWGPGFCLKKMGQDWRCQWTQDGVLHRDQGMIDVHVRMKRLASDCIDSLLQLVWLCMICIPFWSVIADIGAIYLKKCPRACTQPQRMCT